jgi:hypothetical protein
MDGPDQYLAIIVGAMFAAGLLSAVLWFRERLRQRRRMGDIPWRR